MPLLNPSLASLRRSVLRILDRSVSTLMGCFLSCFRVREEDPSRPRSRPIPRQTHSEKVLSRNPLSSVFQYEDNLHGYERMANETEETSTKSQEYHSIRLESSCTTDEALIDEAEFLKACGTIQETPAEIRKAVKRMMVSPPIKPFEQPEVPPTPLDFCRNSTENVDALDNTPCSCISDVQDRGACSVGSSEGTSQGSNGLRPKHPKAETDTAPTQFLHRAPASDAPSRAKSVRFETNTATYSTRSAKKNLFLEDEAASKPSPYPTPLKLSDEMQTPGTDFAANCFYGKGRVRCQYVYPDPKQNQSQWKVLKKEGEIIRDFKEQLEEEKPELGVEASYSSWLKPAYKHQDESYLDFNGRRNELYTTPGDRPIMGLVAVHWNEDECGQNPKCWDGNGIPNTTTKYKEDQRVTWHATPFEERLEKALLSEERSFVSQQG